MKTSYVIVSAALVALLGSCGRKMNSDSLAMADTQNEATLGNSDIEKDADFAVKAADIGMLEVELGGLAQSRATSGSVKEFAQQMINDHGKGNGELAELAKQKNISLPITLSDDSQKKYDELAKLNGTDFDKAYCKAMVKGHKDAISLFKKEAEKGEDGGIKSWAENKVPTLEHHLKMAEETEKAVDHKI